MTVKFVNDLQTKITNVGGISAGATTVGITAGDGAKIAAFVNFGSSEYCFGTFKDASGNRETVKITARATDDLTITRSADGDTARAWAQDDILEFGLCSAALELLYTEALADASTYADNLAGAAVAYVAALSVTTSELNELNGQGCVAADFAKLHAITASAATINGLAALIAANTSDISTNASGIATNLASIAAIIAGTQQLSGLDVAGAGAISGLLAVGSLTVGGAILVDPYIGSVVNRSDFANGGSVLTLTIGGGTYRVKDKIAFWNSALTTVAIGGSPSASTQYYWYLDYSTITSGVAITNANIRVSTTAPTYNHQYKGHYDGDDLCIWGVPLNSGGTDVEPFTHNGNFVNFNNSIQDRSQAVADDTFAGNGVALSIPGFTRAARVAFQTQHVTTGNWTASWAPSSAASVGHAFSWGGVSLNTLQYHHENVTTDASQNIYVKISPSYYGNVGVLTRGFFLPNGI